MAYHDACHLGHAQQVRTQPRDVLRSIPELELVDLPEAALCCGSAGIYNMVMPEAAAELGRAQGRERPLGASRTWSSPPTRAACCRSASTWGVDLPLLHPVQLLDASIRGVPVPRS